MKLYIISMLLTLTSVGAYAHIGSMEDCNRLPKGDDRNYCLAVATGDVNSCEKIKNNFEKRTHCAFEVQKINRQLNWQFKKKE